MNCKCTRFHTTPYHTLVCIECGIERVQSFEVTEATTSFTQSYGWHGVGLYSRSKRFGQMLDQCILGLANSVDEPMLRYLSTYPSFPNTKSLLSVLRTAPLKDKRYCSLHLFSRLYCDDYRLVRVSSYPEVKTNLISLYQQLEKLHSQMSPGQQFISYAFIMNEILILKGFNHFTRYIKKLKCPRRNKRYRTQFVKLIKESDHGCTLARAGGAFLNCDKFDV